MARARTKGGGLFLVVRRGWRAQYVGALDWFRNSDGRPRETGRPVAAYTDREAAEARCAVLEAEARSSLEPFAFFEDYWLDDYTSLSRDEFDKGLRRALPGVRLPRKGKYGERPWFEWWSGIVDQLSAEQRAAVWALLDEVRFYAVVQAPLEGA